MSRVRWLALLSSLLGVFALTVAACGSSDDSSDSGGGSEGISGNTLTIYSSLPLQGTSKGQSEAVISGEKLALKQAGSKVGKYTIKYVVARRLDRSEPGHRGRGPDRSERPQGRPGQDDDLLPRRVQLRRLEGLAADPEQGRHPADQPVEHLRGPDHGQSRASEPGEPEKYYPAEKRTYARVVPKDDIQGAALVATMKEDGCKSVHIFNDKTTYGAGLGKQHRARPRRRRA